MCDLPSLFHRGVDVHVQRYFSGFEEVWRWKKSHLKITLIALVKIASYATFVCPVGVLGLFFLCQLLNRISKNTQEQKIADVASQRLSSQPPVSDASDGGEPCHPLAQRIVKSRIKERPDDDEELKSIVHSEGFLKHPALFMILLMINKEATSSSHFHKEDVWRPKILVRMADSFSNSESVNALLWSLAQHLYGGKSQIDAQCLRGIQRHLDDDLFKISLNSAIFILQQDAKRQEDSSPQAESQWRLLLKMLFVQAENKRGVALSSAPRDLFQEGLRLIDCS